MAVEIVMRTENAAFTGGNARAEVARILREVADKIEEGDRDEGRCMDVNGNGVGTWSATDLDDTDDDEDNGEEPLVLTDEPGKITKLTGPRSVQHPGD